MKNASVVMVMVVGCVSPVTERVSTQPIDEAAVTYRFSGSLPGEGETCRHTPYYRDSLCGTSFRGYFTIPSTPNPDYGDGHYEVPYDEQGRVSGPYGMVLDVDGRRPRVFDYVTVEIANDAVNWQMPDSPLIDTFHVSASASYSNDGFDASFADPTGTAIDNTGLMPDPSRFPEVCSDSLGGCPLVLRDAASDFLAMDLWFSRSPVVLSVPREDRDAPDFFVTAAEWLDADHTAATFVVETFDPFTFATPTCGLWVQVEEAGVLRGVQGTVHHDGRGEQRAVMTIETGAANPERGWSAANITCAFAMPGEPTSVESTSVWIWYP